MKLLRLDPSSHRKAQGKITVQARQQRGVVEGNVLAESRSPGRSQILSRATPDAIAALRAPARPGTATSPDKLVVRRLAAWSKG